MLPHSIALSAKHSPHKDPGECDCKDRLRNCRSKPQDSRSMEWTDNLLIADQFEGNHDVPTGHCTPGKAIANSARRRRQPNFYRHFASPSRGEAMSTMFRETAEELQSTHTVCNITSPGSLTSRIPMAQARTTRFGGIQNRTTRSPYSYKSPPKRAQNLDLISNKKQLHDLGQPEPVSSGFISRIAPPEAWDMADEDPTELQYPSVPDPSPTTPKIHQWLETLVPNSYLGNGNGKDNGEDIGRLSALTASNHNNDDSPVSSSSNKENTSPTRSFTPIQPPIHHESLSTPSRLMKPLENARVPYKTPSRFRHPRIPGGYLATPPVRRLCRDQGPFSESRKNPKLSKSNSNSTGSTLVDSEATAVDTPPFPIYIEPQTPRPGATSPDPLTTSPHTSRSKHSGAGNRTISAPLIPFALATLSPAVSVRRKGRGCQRSSRSPLLGSQRNGEEGQGNRRGRPQERSLKYVEPLGGVAAADSRQKESDGESDSDDEMTGFGEKKVLKVLWGGREVEVLGESKDSEALCRDKPFTKEAEGKAFDFEMKEHRR